MIEAVTSRNDNSEKTLLVWPSAFLVIGESSQAEVTSKEFFYV
jgi:hypothetical protein